MKRFWTSATVVDAPGGWAVQLDGRPMRLPGGGGLTLPVRALAEAVAREWDTAGGAPGGEMTHEDVPLTRIAGTAADRIAPDPGATVEALARYGASDLLCYRAEDRQLAALQAAQWDPWLGWAARRHDAALRVTTGLMPVAQPAEAMGALRAAVAAHPPLELAALGVAVPALGSLVLGLAIADGALDAVEAMRLAVLDETFQEEFWGTDAEALDRRARVSADVALAGRLFLLARDIAA